MRGVGDIASYKHTLYKTQQVTLYKSDLFCFM